LTISGGRVWLPLLATSRDELPPNRLPPGSKMLTARVSPTPITSVGASLEASAKLEKDGGGAAFSRSLSAKFRSTSA